MIPLDKTLRLLTLPLLVFLNPYSVVANILESSIYQEYFETTESLELDPIDPTHTLELQVPNSAFAEVDGTTSLRFIKTATNTGSPRAEITEHSPLTGGEVISFDFRPNSRPVTGTFSIKLINGATFGTEGIKLGLINGGGRVVLFESGGVGTSFNPTEIDYVNGQWYRCQITLDDNLLDAELDTFDLLITDTNDNVIFSRTGINFTNLIGPGEAIDRIKFAEQNNGANSSQHDINIDNLEIAKADVINSFNVVDTVVGTIPSPASVFTTGTDAAGSDEILLTAPGNLSLSYDITILNELVNLTITGPNGEVAAVADVSSGAGTASFALPDPQTGTYTLTLASESGSVSQDFILRIDEPMSVEQFSGDSLATSGTPYDITFDIQGDFDADDMTTPQGTFITFESGASGKVPYSPISGDLTTTLRVDPLQLYSDPQTGIVPFEVDTIISDLGLTSFPATVTAEVTATNPAASTTDSFTFELYGPTLINFVAGEGYGDGNLEDNSQWTGGGANLTISDSSGNGLLTATPTAVDRVATFDQNLDARVAPIATQVIGSFTVSGAASGTEPFFAIYFYGPSGESIRFDLRRKPSGNNIQGVIAGFDGADGYLGNETIVSAPNFNEAAVGIDVGGGDLVSDRLMISFSTIRGVDKDSWQHSIELVNLDNGNDVVFERTSEANRSTTQAFYDAGVYQVGIAGFSHEGSPSVDSVSFESVSITGVPGTLTPTDPIEPVITVFVLDAGNAEINIEGNPNTNYKLVRADDLDFNSPDQDPVPLDNATVGTYNSLDETVTTDSNGEATIQFEMLGTKGFVRAEELP